MGAKWHWTRYEFQHRGAIHAHCFAQLNSSHEIENIENQLKLDKSNNILKQKFSDFIDSLSISEIFPEFKNLELLENPFKFNLYDFSTYEEIFKFYLSLVVKTCMHSKCSKDYCLRLKRGEYKCRFGYPKNSHTDTSIFFDHDKMKIDLKRNNPILNAHNIWQLIGWKSNVDFKIITDKNDLVKYLTKYVTKNEPCTDSSIDFIKNKMND